MTITTDDVLTQEAIRQRVEELVEETLVFRQIYRTMDVSGINSDAIKVKKLDDLMGDPEPVGDGSEFPEDEESAQKVTIDVDETWGKQASITRKAQNNSIMDEIAMQVDMMARRMDEWLDELAFNELDRAVEDNTNVLNANSDSTFDYADAVEVRQELRSKNYDPQLLIIDTEAEGDLLNDDKFTHATDMADTEVIREGQIGRISGMDVVVTTNVTFTNSPAGYAVDPRYFGYECVRENVDTNQYVDDDTHSTKVQIWTTRTYYAIQPDAAAKIEG